MQYNVIDPTLEKLNELARLSHNMLYYQKYWNEHFGCTNRAKMFDAQQKVEEWLLKNTEPDEDKIDGRKGRQWFNSLPS